MAYNPSVPPQLGEDLLPYLQDEFLRVAQAFNDGTDGQMGVRHTMPERYKPGTVIYLSGGPKADPLGTGQEGLYRYTTDKVWEYVGGGGSGPGPGPGGNVESVNGKTGVVVLNASDVKADPTGTAGTAVTFHEAKADPHPQYLKSGSFATVATTGQYDDLFGKPALFSGLYGDLVGKPTLFSGRYSDLTGKPDLTVYQPKSDMSNYQPKSDMVNYQPKSEMAGYVARWELGDYALKTYTYSKAEADSYFASKASYNTFVARAESKKFIKANEQYDGIEVINPQATFRTNALNETFGGGIQLREGEGSGGTVVSNYPKITFHWGGIIVKNLGMNAQGELSWGGENIGFNKDWLQWQPVGSWDIGIDKGFSVKYFSNHGIAGVIDGALISSSYSSDWAHQMLCDWRTGDIYTSFKAAGARGATRKVVFEDTLGPLLTQVAQMQTTINQMAVKIQQMEAWVAAHS